MFCRQLNIFLFSRLASTTLDTFNIFILCPFVSGALRNQNQGVLKNSCFWVTETSNNILNLVAILWTKWKWCAISQVLFSELQNGWTCHTQLFISTQILKVVFHHQNQILGFSCGLGFDISKKNSVDVDGSLSKLFWRRQVCIKSLSTSTGRCRNFFDVNRSLSRLRRRRSVFDSDLSTSTEIRKRLVDVNRLSTATCRQGAQKKVFLRKNRIKLHIQNMQN